MSIVRKGGIVMRERHSRRSRSSSKKANRYDLGISWRLFGVLLMFIAFALLVIWVFQVALLNRFYEQSKMEEFKTTEAALSAAIPNTDDITGVASFYATEYDQCISVYRVEDGTATAVISPLCTTSVCMIHHASSDTLSRYFDNAAAADDGVYIERIAHPVRGERDNSSRPFGTVYVSVKEVDGALYVIMLNAEHIPLNATVNTLEKQFGWIACVLLVGALVVALIISKTVCKPLNEMGKSAEKLAKGNYHANFKGGNYRESQELADALNFAAYELSKADNLQKELVANISHDLRTPLTMIKGYGEMMRDIPGENTPENIQVVVEETERLCELVNDVLDLSKIRSGAVKPDIEDLNLTQTVSEVMTRYSKLTEHDGYNITFSFDREIYVSADRTMLLQVIYNLINNAVNYTGEDKCVRVVQSQSSDRVRISVTDTGEGIAKEDMPLVWDRYYKVDKVHKRARIGTGLGLSIVKGVLEAHGATYGISSKLGEGATFWFELDIDRCEFIPLE